ncbi:MAG: globin domain-containing protein [Gammaproteobacteria bacterium]|nr:globin domain-containing protein [Gammaproteobacteria bacterium]
MTPKQIELIQSSWNRISQDPDQAAELFYKKLFSLNPELKQLFKPDMKGQGRKLMAMLNTAVNNLHRLESILPIIQASGRRHIDYGVKNEDYDTVAEALLWTLGEGLGHDFTEEVKLAWVDVYNLLANTMKESSLTLA